MTWRIGHCLLTIPELARFMNMQSTQKVLNIPNLQWYNKEEMSKSAVPRLTRDSTCVFPPLLTEGKEPFSPVHHERFDLQP
jgi:hypothetical protein